ncbi:MAG: zf-HC2 domain-containing protein [Spirochaetes bacterium]|nr:zf-HC2 domain-containing protein [Spirochaetota bacterium]
MCPDKEILSAFIDNELDGEFKKIVENHVNSCKKCSLEIESINSLRTLLYDELPLSQIKDAEEKIWHKIAPVVQKSKPKKVSIWNMKIAIPVPVAAAAAVIFVSAVISLYSISFNRINDNYSEPRFSFSDSITFYREEDFSLFQAAQVIDVDLTLPESTIFVMRGTPSLIREADFLNRKR